MANLLQLFKRISIILALLLMVMFVGCQARHSRSPEAYILPEGYIGAFYIIYGAANGKVGKEADGVKIYEIPSTGVLLTQAGANEGWVESDNINFYYRRANGDLVKIDDRWVGSLSDTPENRADKKLMIFGGGLGEIQRDAASCRIVFQAFHVGTKKNILDGTNHFNIEDVIEKNKIECRAVGA